VVVAGVVVVGGVVVAGIIAGVVVAGVVVAGITEVVTALLASCTLVNHSNEFCKSFAHSLNACSDKSLGKPASIRNANDPSSIFL